MAYIIQRLYDKEKKEAVTLEGADMSKVEKDFETDKVEVYSYESFSYPVPYSDNYATQYVFNGDKEEAPINFYKRGDKVVVDEEELADTLYEKWGSGQYQVFKRGGTPPYTPYFRNRFIKPKNNGGE